MTQSTPTERTVDYATPRPTLGSFLLAYFLQLPITALMLALVLFIMVFVVPKFRETFNDFRTSLPFLTESLLAASYTASQGWILLLLPLAFILPLPAAYAARKSPDRRSQVLAITLSLLLQTIALIFFLVLAMLALMLPMLKLIHSVSGGAAGTGP